MCLLRMIFQSTDKVLSINMAISLPTKVIIIAAICFAAILITIIVAIVVVTDSHEEGNQNKSTILIYWLKCMYS